MKCIDCDKKIENNCLDGRRRASEQGHCNRKPDWVAISRNIGKYEYERHKYHYNFVKVESINQLKNYKKQLLIKYYDDYLLCDCYFINKKNELIFSYPSNHYCNLEMYFNPKLGISGAKEILILVKR